MSFLIGGSHQESGNSNNGYLKNLLTPEIGNGVSASGSLAGLLGLGGGPSQTSALNNLWNSSGMNSILNAGSNAITGNQAAGGMLQSGATGKALEGYGQSLGRQNLGMFAQMLQGLTNSGNQAASTVGSAGQYGASSSTNGLFGSGGITGSNGQGGLTGLMSLFSDRRLKTDIERIGELGPLGVYQYRYLWDEPGDPLRTGVMADEVDEHYPLASGPDVGGYRTVDYAKLAALA